MRWDQSKFGCNVELGYRRGSGGMLRMEDIGMEVAVAVDGFLIQCGGTGAIANLLYLLFLYK